MKTPHTDALAAALARVPNPNPLAVAAATAVTAVLDFTSLMRTNLPMDEFGSTRHAVPRGARPLRHRGGADASEPPRVLPRRVPGRAGPSRRRRYPKALRAHIRRRRTVSRMVTAVPLAIYIAAHRAGVVSLAWIAERRGTRLDELVALVDARIAGGLYPCDPAREIRR